MSGRGRLHGYHPRIEPPNIGNRPLQALRRLVARHPAASVLLAGLLLVLPPVVAVTARLSGESAAETLLARSEATLRLSLAALRNQLGRYENLPRVLASNPIFAALLAEPRSASLTARVNGYLERLAQVTGASDIYLMDSSGLTLAASNWNGNAPFVGQNFSYRPYFQGAMAGGLGRYYALGTTSRRRGYYFAYPVERDDGVLGVIAVKVNLAEVEDSWRDGPDEVLVSDELDVLFMSSRRAWLFRTLRALSTEELARIAIDRQYPVEQLKPLPIVLEEDYREGVRRLLVEVDDAAGTRRTEYLMRSANMPETGWRVEVLADAAPLHAQARTAAIAAALALTSLLLMLAWLVQRRVHLRERLAGQARAHHLLEERVRERTAELEREVAERIAAEAELRRAQNELIQASKLSALGQVSAGMSHELNQPLSAIRSFAENAGKLFDLGRVDEARDNLVRIAQLTERMARIMRNLRTFARREDEEIVPVNLSSVIDDSLALLDQRMTQMGVRLTRALPHTDVWVHGGPVRLQQVMVNIVANALDAMEDAASRELFIGLVEDEDHATLTVRDSGAGIPEQVLNDIFVPFFTTKEVNEGLGLGLSISYGIVTAFGGSISAGNVPGGGAEFSIRLIRTSVPETSHAGAA